MSRSGSRKPGAGGPASLAGGGGVMVAATGWWPHPSEAVADSRRMSRFDALAQRRGSLLAFAEMTR